MKPPLVKQIVWEFAGFVHTVCGHYSGGTETITVHWFPLGRTISMCGVEFTRPGTSILPAAQSEQCAYNGTLNELELQSCFRCLCLKTIYYAEKSDERIAAG